jgi:hypothetical protein
MKHGEARKLMYEYVQGELESAQARLLEEHIARCNKCYGELQLVKVSIRMISVRPAKPSDERSPEFWARFVETVGQRTESEKTHPAAVNPIWDEIWSVMTFRRSLVLSAVGVAAVAVIALLLWTSVPGIHVDEQPAMAIGGVKADSVRLELANYFRTSKILLVGISNISLERGEHIDISAEKQAARKLIQQARYLDNRVSDERSHQLIKAMERILLELANMEQKVDLPDVEIVRSGIHQENMLFKIRMAESEFNVADESRMR